MRVAGLILGLVLTAIIMIQAVFAAGMASLSLMWGDPSTSYVLYTMLPALAGFASGFVCLLGAAFIWAKPGFSFWAFLVAGVLALATSASVIANFAVWGILAFGLAVIAHFGKQEKEFAELTEGDRRREPEYDEWLRARRGK